MRPLLLATALLLIAGCHPAPTPPPNKDWTITLTFTYDFTNFVPCSTAVIRGCISNFTWGYLQGTTPIPLKTAPVTICTGTTQPETCTDSTMSTVGIGTVTPYAIANGIDNSGAQVNSATATGPANNIAIGNPGNVKEVFN